VYCNSSNHLFFRFEIIIANVKEQNILRSRNVKINKNSNNNHQHDEYKKENSIIFILMKSVALVEFIHAKVEHLVYYMLCGINVPKTKSVLYVALGTKKF